MLELLLSFTFFFFHLTSIYLSLHYLSYSFNSTWIFYYEKTFFFFFLDYYVIFIFYLDWMQSQNAFITSRGALPIGDGISLNFGVLHYMISFLVEMTMPWRFCPEFLCACGIINLIFHICDSVTFTFVLINFISTLTGKKTKYYHKTKRELDRWRT